MAIPVDIEVGQTVTININLEEVFYNSDKVRQALDFCLTYLIANTGSKFEVLEEVINILSKKIIHTCSHFCLQRAIT
jgi:hypothetical protein